MSLAIVEESPQAALAACADLRAAGPGDEEPIPISDPVEDEGFDDDDDEDDDEDEPLQAIAAQHRHALTITAQ